MRLDDWHPAQNPIEMQLRLLRIPQAELPQPDHIVAMHAIALIQLLVEYAVDNRIGIHHAAVPW